MEVLGELLSVQPVQEWRKIFQRYFFPLYLTSLSVVGLGVLYLYFSEPGLWGKGIWSTVFGGLGVLGNNPGIRLVRTTEWELYLRHKVDIRAPFHHIEDLYESVPEVSPPPPPLLSPPPPPSFTPPLMVSSPFLLVGSSAE